MPKATAIRRDKDGELIDKPLPPPCTAVRKLDWLQNLNPLDGIDLVIVDEASMVSDKIWKDLTKYGVPVLAVGDHGQLPPVKSEFNLMRDPEIKLETIVRQLAGSPIIKMSMLAREQGHIPFGEYGPGVVKVPHTQLGRVELDPDSEDQMLIVGYNKTRNAINEQLRRQCNRSGEPQKGDVVICLRNDYERGVFNGMRGRVQEFDSANPMAPWAEIEVFGEDFIYEGLVSLDQFGQPKTGTEVNRRLGLWDYGYALTAHKAQGSEAQSVVVIEERMPSATDEYHARWLYTAITRARTELTLVGA
jgi:exodeoxyribonuclease-5